jgi:hypothetical protein
LPFRSGNLSDLRGEKQGKRHVPYLVLQLLDPVDMCILILENVFQYLPRGEVINFSSELDGLIVGLDGTQLERVIAGELFGSIRADGQVPSRKRIRPMSFSACFISSMARFSKYMCSFSYPQLAHISE